MNTSDSGEMCRSLAWGQGMCLNYDRDDLLRLVETVGCSSTTYLLAAFLLPLYLYEFERCGYIFRIFIRTKPCVCNELTLIADLQKLHLTYRVLRGACKKENLSKDQRFFNNFQT